MLARIDIQQMRFTQNTFDDSFQSIRSEVFIRTPVSNGYIIAVLGFSEVVHKYHCSSSWYAIDILMHSLVGVLEGIDFHPEQLTPSSHCIILRNKVFIHLHAGCGLVSTHIMGKFYLDLEFTNGNYYLVDILEIALVAEESGNVFHSYVKIHYSVPQRVHPLAGITNITIKSLGVPFRTVIYGLVEFLHREQAQSETVPVIIAHGGYLHDFPILLASCMKHNWDGFGILTECMFVDSMQVLQDDGYKRPCLDALCEGLNVKRSSHSAIEDVYILKTVCNKKPEILDHPYGWTFGDITNHLNRELAL